MCEFIKGGKVKAELPLSMIRGHREGVEVEPHSFLTSSLHEGDWFASHPRRFTLVE